MVKRWLNGRRVDIQLSLETGDKKPNILIYEVNLLVLNVFQKHTTHADMCTCCLAAVAIFWWYYAFTYTWSTSPCVFPPHYFARAPRSTALTRTIHDGAFCCFLLCFNFFLFSFVTEESKHSQIYQVEKCVLMYFIYLVSLFFIWGISIAH